MQTALPMNFPGATLLSDEELWEVSGGNIFTTIGVKAVRGKVLIVSGATASFMTRDQFTDWLVQNAGSIALALSAPSSLGPLGVGVSSTQSAIFRALPDSAKREIAQWVWDSVHALLG